MTQLPKTIGTLAAIWRYPVKSMLGEQLSAIDVAGEGLVGDRAFALLDKTSQKVASAKNPRLWPNLFDHAASLAAPTGSPPMAGHLRLALPGGERINGDDPSLNERLSRSVAREVELIGRSPALSRSEGYWPDYEWLPNPGQTFEFPLPAGTFFDCSPVHLVTTATLSRLAALGLGSRFDVARFRPNLVVDCAEQAETFAEDFWLGRELLIGGVVLKILRSSPRCVMTTLAQANLPKDPQVLRTAVQHNAGNVGVYATVLQPGQVQQGATVRLS